MIGRRRILAGLAATAAGVGITSASVPAAQRPDGALSALVAEWLAAREAYYAARTAVDDAEGRARGRYPAELPRWWDWRGANHPAGKYEVLPVDEDPSPRMQALNAEWMQYPLDADGQRHPPEEWIKKFCAAICAAKDDYYAPVRPVYDRLVADREAAVAAIDAEEGIAALKEAQSAAWDHADDAHETLVNYRPATAPGFVVKALALLRSPFDPSSYDEDSGEAMALIADAEALIGGGA